MLLEKMPGQRRMRSHAYPKVPVPVKYGWGPAAVKSNGK